MILFGDSNWPVLLLKGVFDSFSCARGFDLTPLYMFSRLAGSEEEEEEGEWKLYFKLYCFLDVESMPKEGVEFAFMFEQVRLIP